MNNVHRAYLARLVCLAGGMVQLIYGLLAVRFTPTQNLYGWDEALWALANVGMIGAVYGLLALDVARLRRLAMVGTTLVILGHLIRIVASALRILHPSGNYRPLL